VNARMLHTAVPAGCASSSAMYIAEDVTRKLPLTQNSRGSRHTVLQYRGLHGVGLESASGHNSEDQKASDYCLRLFDPA